MKPKINVFNKKFLIFYNASEMSVWFSIFSKWYEFRDRIWKVRQRVGSSQVRAYWYLSKSRKICVSNLTLFHKMLCIKFTDFVIISKCHKAFRFHLLFLVLIFSLFTIVRKLKCKESKAVLYTSVCPLHKIPK